MAKHNCTWCHRPFDDPEVLGKHAESEHPDEMRHYRAMWEDPTPERISDVVMLILTSGGSPADA